MENPNTDSCTQHQSTMATKPGPPGSEGERAVNVMVPASVYLRAKVASAQSDLPFKTWVAIALSNAEAFPPGERT